MLEIYLIFTNISVSCIS